MRRDIDLPAGDLITVVEKLSELSRRVTADSQLPVDTMLDYTAAIEVYDVLETGRILVVWTVWFSAPDVRECIQKYWYTRYSGMSPSSWPMSCAGHRRSILQCDGQPLPASSWVQVMTKDRFDMH